MPHRVALYVRVGPHHEDPAAQKDTLRTFTESAGAIVSAVYTDTTLPGRFRERPALAALLRDASRGTFDRVLILSFDRIAWSTRHCLRLFYELQHCGAQLCALADEYNVYPNVQCHPGLFYRSLTGVQEGLMWRLYRLEGLLARERMDLRRLPVTWPSAPSGPQHVSAQPRKRTARATSVRRHLRLVVPAPGAESPPDTP